MSMPTTGRWGWYKDHEGVERQRMSKLLEHVETDRFNLEQYFKRQVAVGLASRPDLLLGIKAIGRPGVEGFTREQKSSLNGLAKQAEEAAKDTDGGVLGTAMHTATERIDRGEKLTDVDLPYPFSASLAAYEAMRRLNGWRSIAIEQTVVVDDLDVAGTFDRVDEIPGLSAMLGPGRCQYGDRCEVDHGAEGLDAVIVDVKTEAEPWRNGIHIAPQLAGYSRAKRMFLAEGPCYVAMPCVRQDVGVVVHVRDGDSVPYFINLTEGWEAAVAAMLQRERMKRSKRQLGQAGCWFAPLPPPLAKRPIAADIVRSHAGPELRAAAEAMPSLPPLTGGIVQPYGTPILVGEQGPEIMPDHFAGRMVHAVGDTVTVGGIGFTKHAEWPSQALRNACNNCAPLLAQASATRVDGTSSEPCRDCGAVEPQYVMPSGADLVGGHGPMPQAPAAVAERVEQAQIDHLIRRIWQAAHRDVLASIYAEQAEIGFPVPWTGAVKMAGEARLRVVECGQRALHSGGGKCACGWVPGVAP